MRLQISRSEIHSVKKEINQMPTRGSTYNLMVNFVYVLLKGVLFLYFEAQKNTTLKYQVIMLIYLLNAINIY